MCYLVREPFEDRAGDSAPASVPPRLRTRWAAGLAVALVGGLAVAALVTPSPTQPERIVSHPAAPIAQRAGTLPAGGGTQGTLPADDDVPTAPAQASYASGHCHHDL